MLKQIRKVRLLILAVVLAASGLGGLVPVNAAGSAQLQLVPSSGTLAVGATLTVTLNVIANPSEPADSVIIRMNYDASKLQFQSINASGSAFGMEFSGSGGGGQVNMMRAVDVLNGQTTVTGTGKVASINFLAIAAGNAVISFASSTEVLGGIEDIWNGNTTGGTYTIQAPAGGGGGGGGGGGTGTGQGSGSGSGSSGSGSGSTGGSGGSGGQGSGGGSGGGDTNIPVDEQPAAEEPDPAAISYLIAILVLAADGSPLQDVEVTLADKTSKTDVNGTAGFIGIPAGEHTVSAAGMTQTILVADGDPTAVQEFELRQPSGGFKLPRWTIGAGIGLFVLLAGGLLIKRSLGTFGLSRFKPSPAVPAQGTAVTGDTAVKPPQPASASVPEPLPEPTVIKPSAPPQPEVPAEPEKPAVTGDNSPPPTVNTPPSPPTPPAAGQV